MSDRGALLLHQRAMTTRSFIGILGLCGVTLLACSGGEGASNPEASAGNAGSSAGTTAVATGGAAGSGGVAGVGGGGAAASAGTGSGGSASSAGSSGNAGSGGAPPTPTVKNCAQVGPSQTVNATIVVPSGQTFDGNCQRFIANSETLGDGGQEEGQLPVFEIHTGGTLLNVVLGAPAADGIHTLGNATLKNVIWEDIGEDAMTIARPGTVVLDGGSAQKGADKVFQINAESTFRVSNFKAWDAGKFIRQNGDTSFTAHVFIDRCDISDMEESIFRTDSGTSTVSMTNTRYSDIGEELFMGVADGNVTESNNDEY
jgi:pectate lyase C